MIKSFFVSITLFLFLLLLASFETKDWVLFQKDNFKILFPTFPSIDSTFIESKLANLTVYTFMYESTESEDDSNLVYGLSVTDYPEKYFLSPEKSFLNGLFEGMIKGVVKNVNGVLLSEKEIDFKTYKGREIKIDCADGSAIATMKIILIKNRIFALQTISLVGKENNNNAIKFYSSFDLR